MSNRSPPMEEGEAAVLRSMESTKPSLTKRNTSNATAASGTKPSIYDALNEPGREMAGTRPKLKPSLSRVVRKIMTEQQKAQGGESTPGHTRSKSTLQVQNLLKEMGDKGGSESRLDDVFQQEIFHPGSIEFQTKSSKTDLEPAEEEALEADTMAELDDVEQPHDTTPLLQTRNDGDVDVFRRLRGMKQGKSFFDSASVKAFFWGILCHCWLLVFAALLALLALVFYYTWSNPSLDALPGNATLAWWFNFLARQIVLFEVRTA